MIRARPGGLLRRLLLFILLFSLCFTVLASSVQLYIEYRREMLHSFPTRRSSDLIRKSVV